MEFARRSLRSCVLPALVGVSALILARPAMAQTSGAETIREALAYQRNTPVSANLGKNVTVRGVLIVSPIRLEKSAALADIQDATGGVTVYSPNPALLSKNIHRGDELQVTGKIQDFKGQTEILVANFKDLGPGSLPGPRDALAGNIIGVRYLGTLVRVEGKIRMGKDSEGRPAIILSDRSGEIPIYGGGFSLRDQYVLRQVERGGTATVVGIANYYAPKGGLATSGYRLIPREPEDVVFHPAPSYWVLAADVGVAFLILALIYVTIRRQHATRRALEMAKLVENLRYSEKALRKSEQRYRHLYDSNLAGLFHTTLDGRILNCNESFARMFGYGSPDEVKATPLGAHEFYANPGERKEFLAKLGDKKSLTNVETRLKRKDGSAIWVIENVSLVEGDNGAFDIIEGTVVDITERKQLEEQLRQTQKMEAIGKLAGGVAHDLNNLLTVINGNSELLVEMLGQNRGANSSLGQIKKASDQAADLIRQLLAFSRMQVLQPKVLDLNSVIAETAKMLPRLLREDIEVVFSRGAGLGRVKADQNQINQILFNLATNARDAMPKGGKLTIETANVDISEEDARMHPDACAGRHVTFSVTDTGTGMSAETQSRMFEPFFTTKEPGKGTGLGLATVYGVVRQSGGSIRVQSEPGRGTTIKIYLPRVKDKAARLNGNGSRAPLPQGNETILLVEDQPGIRELARMFLEGLGYTVLESTDGAEALEIARRHDGEIHLVLTDVVMPKMGGYELAAQMASLRPDARLVYMSGYVESASQGTEEAQRSQFHLQKPFSMESLARSVYEALHAESCVTISAD